MYLYISNRNFCLQGLPSPSTPRSLWRPCSRVPCSLGRLESQFLIAQCSPLYPYKVTVLSPVKSSRLSLGRCAFRVTSSSPVVSAYQKCVVTLLRSTMFVADPRTACLWQAMVNDQTRMQTQFKAAMSKLEVLGQPRNLVDCSDVYPSHPLIMSYLSLMTSYALCL